MKFTAFSRWLALWAVIPVLAAAEYSIVDIGGEVGTDINSGGVVAGYSPPFAFVYDTAGLRYTQPKARLLGDANLASGNSGTSSYGIGHLEWTGINDAGRLVGFGILTNKTMTGSPNHDPRIYPSVWDGSGDAIAVNLPDQGAFGVNGEGTVVGGIQGAFALVGTNVTTLAALGMTTATAINNQGVIAGSSRGQAAILDNGVLTVLDVQETGGSSTNSSEAKAIASDGRVAGTIKICSPSRCTSRGFVWSAGSKVFLDSPGGRRLDALGINDAGVVVGSMDTVGGDLHAFVYRAGELIDLNTLIPNAGWVLTEARAINGSGQIVGVGLLHGSSEGFLLNPIRPGDPDPPSIVQAPHGGQLALGQTFTLTVAASGTAPLAYQWQRDSGDLEGETGASLTLVNVDARAIGIYRVIVRNPGGEAYSAEVQITVLDPAVSIARYSGITINGTKGGRYRVEAAPGLDGTNWISLGWQGEVALTNSTQLWFDLESGTNPVPRYYRVIRELP